MSVGDREQVLRESLEGRWCAKCRTVPRVAWMLAFAAEFLAGDDNQDNGYILRCECWPVAPTLVRRPGRQHTRVLGGLSGKPVTDEDRKVVGEMFR